MLLDLHAHSRGISRCCSARIEKILQTAKRVGLDGIALTNHYQKDYVNDGDYRSFAMQYLAEYRRARELGQELELTVLFGIEVTLEHFTNVHLLIYGVPEQFLPDHPTLFDYTQEHLYRVVHEYGGLLVQAHPYRRGDRLLDVSLLDGIEINCHPRYESTYLDALSKIATDSGLLLTCGGDYHADTPRVRCGMHLPDTIRDTVGLADYLTHAEELRLCVTEVGETTPHEFRFCPTPRPNKT